ncbi:Alpha/Beta hydrolase protein [Russula compacta]|nr:Alpha/Beta hydrolase protein [Russula compacta]
MATQISPLTTFLQGAGYFVLRLCGVYVALVALAIIPFVQRQLIYLHNFKFPPLHTFKARNVHIRTADNETLGAWFTFADPFYATHKADLVSPSPSSSSRADELIRFALRAHPTILFLHGNAATRAAQVRVRHYQAFTARLRANVLALDYRGFGDSTGTPSEAGLALDARAAWDWLRSRGAPPENVLVFGNSLGTGVAVQFLSALEAAEQLRGDEQRAQEGGPERPRGVVLTAAFSSVETLLDTYYVAGLVPLLAPLQVFPFIARLVKRFLVHRFDSLANIVSLTVPLLVVHAENDGEIPHSHSQTLFDAFLEQHLPPLPDIATTTTGASNEVAERKAKLSEERRALRRELVATSDIARVGRVEVFSKDRSHGNVVFLRTLWGGHDTVGLAEGVQDYIASMFKMR